MPNTLYLLLWPWVALVPVFLLQRRRPWGHLLSAAALALEAYASLHLLPDAGLYVLGHTVRLAGAGRMALAWVSGASALLALAGAVHNKRNALPLGLLALTSAAGFGLALDPLPFAFLVLWLAIPLAALLFRPGDACTNRGVLRVLALTAVGLPAFLLASLLVSQTPLISPDQPPPWGIIAILAVVGSAAWLSLFPFHAWASGLARSGEPLAAGWVLGVFQPLVLITLARAFAMFPDLALQPGARQVAQVVGMASVVIGAAFAASAHRAGHVWGYSAVVSAGWLLFAALSGAAISMHFYWMAVAAYSASTILVAIGMLGVGGGYLSRPLDEWRGVARGRGGSVALLLIGGLALCTLPLSMAGRVYSPPATLPSGGLSAIFSIVPLLAAAGWWRVFWVSIQRDHTGEASQGRRTNLFAWLLAALAIASFVWSGLWMRLGEAFARALGGG